MIQIQLDPRSSIPLYRQLANSLRLAIRSEQIAPGAQMPTEAELCEHYKLSRPVVRQAYKCLLEEALIVRHQGKGTFVRTHEVNYNLITSILPLTQKIQLMNLTPRVVELSRETRPAMELTQTQLELGESDQVFSTMRLYYGNEETLFVTHVMLPLKVFPGLDQHDFKDVSLWTLIDEIYHVKPKRSKLFLKAVVLPSEICDILQLPHGSPGFRMDTLNFSADGTPIELSLCYMKGIGARVSLNFPFPQSK